MYSASIDNKNFELSLNENKISIDNEEYHLELQKQIGNNILFTLNNKNIEATVLDFNKENKTVKIKVKNNFYKVQLKNSLDLKVEKMGMGISTKKGANNLIAPMPGLILKVLVEEGQEVEKDTPLLILEAMKMENVFKAPKKVTIEKILVEPKQTVEKKQELITFIL